MDTSLGNESVTSSNESDISVSEPTTRSLTSFGIDDILSDRSEFIINKSTSLVMSHYIASTTFIVNFFQSFGKRILEFEDLSDDGEIQKEEKIENQTEKGKSHAMLLFNS